jgi:hypothetical protein
MLQCCRELCDSWLRVRKPRTKMAVNIEPDSGGERWVLVSVIWLTELAVSYKLWVEILL